MWLGILIRNLLILICQFPLSSHATFNLQYHQQTFLFPYHIYQDVICLTSWFYCMLHPVCNISQEPWLSFIAPQNMSNRSQMIREIEMCQLVFFSEWFLLADNGEDYCWNMTPNVCNHIYFSIQLFKLGFQFFKKGFFLKSLTIYHKGIYFSYPESKIVFYTKLCIKGIHLLKGFSPRRNLSL